MQYPKSKRNEINHSLFIQVFLMDAWLTKTEPQSMDYTDKLPKISRLNPEGLTNNGLPLKNTISNENY